jgi:ornithine cyclodeaminase/alanine dehydrogenase-like protein (mu-crystallin family)
LSRAVTLDDAIGALEQAFMDYNRGDIVLGGRLMAPCGKPGDTSLVLPATHIRKQYYGFKQATTFSENAGRGLPTVLSQYFLYSNVTGQPRAVMDFMEMTSIKTGVAAAIAARHLARPDTRVVGIIGSGVLSRPVLAAICRVMKIERVNIFDLNPRQARVFATYAQEVLDVECLVAESSRGCVRDAQIVCTCTTSRKPVLDGDDLSPGCHINAMGSYNLDMQELDEKTVNRADRIVTDVPRDTLNASGDLACLANKDVVAALDRIMSGEIPGRKSEKDITIYESVGFSVLDMALALFAHEACLSKGFGQDVAFSSRDSEQ